jgi:hypothetical protein
MMNILLEFGSCFKFFLKYIFLEICIFLNGMVRKFIQVLHGCRQLVSWDVGGTWFKILNMNWVAKNNFYIGDFDPQHLSRGVMKTCSSHFVHELTK